MNKYDEEIKYEMLLLWKRIFAISTENAQFDKGFGSKLNLE